MPIAQTLIQSLQHLIPSAKMIGRSARTRLPFGQESVTLPKTLIPSAHNTIPSAQTRMQSKETRKYQSGPVRARLNDTRRTKKAGTGSGTCCFGLRSSVL